MTSVFQGTEGYCSTVGSSEYGVGTEVSILLQNPSMLMIESKCRFRCPALLQIFVDFFICPLRISDSKN